MPKDQRQLAVIIAYFKRREGKPSKVAQACKELLEMYGSPASAAEATGGTVKKPESISVWARFLDLPPETRELFDCGKISRSLIYDLVSVAEDRRLVSDLAKAIAGLQCKDAIRVIREVKKSRSADVVSVKKRIMDELDARDVYVALIGLPSELCKGLTQEDALHVLEDWLETKKSFKTGTATADKELKPFILKIPRNTYLQLRRISKNPADLIKEVLVVRLREEHLLE